MRVLLFTGKGGVGKTTVAAGTAAFAAASGLKTLILSTDAAHSLGDALGCGDAGAPSLGHDPLEVAPGLYAQQVEPRRRFERSWREVQEYLLDILDAAGVDRVEAEELTVLPGAEEVIALLELRDHVQSGPWDVVVVDCAPTAETLRLLALPEALARYMDRVFPPENRLARSLGPMLGRVSGVPMPNDRVFAAMDRLRAELGEVREVLTASGASVRLVLTPESLVVAEARRTYTSLCLYGYQVDAVIANRVFPAEGSDPWRRGWVASQERQLADVAESFVSIPVHRSEYQSEEPVGVEALAAFAADLYADADPLAVTAHEDPIRVERSGDEYVLSLAVPLAQRDEMGLARAGDELVITVGSARRVLALPSALRRCTVEGAALRDDRLRVRFAPDPSLWGPV